GCYWHGARSRRPRPCRPHHLKHTRPPWTFAGRPSTRTSHSMDMPPALIVATTVQLDTLRHVKMAMPVVLLTLFWCWETWRPFFGQPQGRYRHAGHNLAIALFNTVILGLAFGSVTSAVANWTVQHEYGFLNVGGLAGPTRFALALVFLDGWMYIWHRA